MNKLATQLFNRITTDANEYDFPAELEPERDKEQEALFDEMRRKFSDTLTPEQAQAFEALLDIYESVSWDRYYQGVTLGMYLAKGLQELIVNPMLALQAASEDYTPILDANNHNIKTLNEYFKHSGKEGQA